jgi:hypothetical protein
MREVIKDIIELTANIDENREVWGKDTNCGTIDEIIDDALKILANYFDWQCGLYNVKR